MGNNNSELSGMKIEDKAVEIADFWSQHTAHLPKSPSSILTVFIGELFVNGPLWTIRTPLEKSSKNLMIHRHPCILKYISSWSKSSKFYLVVEYVKPLSHVLPTLNSLQICIGLYNILKSLNFLHKKAKTSHNNLCLASIYTTEDGAWKLGGMEFTCKYEELTSDFLNKSRENRYKNAVDVNEENHLQKGVSKEFVDAYAFFVLVNDLLKPETLGNIPAVTDFKNLCKDGVENLNAESRPKLEQLLSHSFFNHEFIHVHSFLVELPLKSDEMKLEFFSTLFEKLKNFDEDLVASQLGDLLLSRMVLLNPVAQKDILPRLFNYKKSGENDEALFSEEIFKKSIIPRIIKVFGVRDAQIRLLLLNYFKKFIPAFTVEELKSSILPELLVGIKDTNDVLVSSTLQALSDLVLILGAEVVIGGKRAKLFNDGRPNLNKKHRKLKVAELQENLLVDLPERPRPDGEEFENSNDEIEHSEELEWEDWEQGGISQNIEEIEDTNSNIEEKNVTEKILNIEENSTSFDEYDEIKIFNSRIIEPKMKEIRLQDIDSLDIKTQKNEDGDEIDFFKDMEPKIESSKFSETEQKNNKLECKVGEFDQDGWEDEDWE